jgi:probable HAF family extracellular repeat protein
MSTQQHIRKASHICLTILIAGCCGAALAQAPAPAQTQAKAKPKAQYNVSNLASLGGTSSGGNSINDGTWVAGYSRLPDNQSRHATLWRNGSLFDLGTLGGPNSSVT